MTTKENCRHVWHNVMTERGISFQNPRYQDDVIAGLYCPKCLATQTLIFHVNRQRSGSEKFDEEMYKAIEASNQEEEKKASTAASVAAAQTPEQRVANIKRNLTKLGYTESEISKLLTPVNGKIDYTRFVESLKTEHKPQAMSIFTNSLM